MEIGSMAVTRPAAAAADLWADPGKPGPEPARQGDAEADESVDDHGPLDVAAHARLLLVR